ncbi:metabotropic glutamate receptor 8-like [Diadema antillarum]|uniref:metabotropic glutamate receptor 8-like n=1 Tax=Diadema antillarum TaxID=105358 RepID=UPI003A89558E
MQSVEAMLYTLDMINNGSILPGFTLGLRAFDDCNQEAYSLEQSVKFANESLTELWTKWREEMTSPQRVTGVVGASSSACSIQVANLLKLFKIPQVTYWATINDLSNKDRFPYLFRTVPPDRHQALAMLHLLRHFNWTYASIVHDRSNYAMRAVEELTRLLKEQGICLATTLKFPSDVSNGDDNDYDEIVSGLLLKPRARVVIIWSLEIHASRLLQAVQRRNKEGHFIWIGSDSLSGRQYHTLHNEAALEGAITIHPTTKLIKGFDTYFTNLNPRTNRRNPWFLEYWEVLNNCTWSNTDFIASHNRVVHRPPMSPRFTRRCTGDERPHALSSNYHQLYQLQFVSDALLAFAYALREMHRDFCGGIPGLCDRMRPVQGDDLKRFLSTVQFEGITGASLKFDSHGDGPALYTLLNYQQVASGEYKYVTIGHFSDKIYLNGSEAQFKLASPEYPKSECSVACKPWEKKILLEDECCSRCEPCGDIHRFYVTDGGRACGECERGRKTNASYTGCVLVPAEPVHPEGWAVLVVVFAILGILTTILITVVLCKYSTTPIVKASGRELMAILLFGVFLCYTMAMLFFVYPTPGLCAAHQLMMAHGFTVCYSAILVKTNRVHRIFQNARVTPKRPEFISPTSQVIITVVLIGMQLILSGALMVASPPRVTRFVVSYQVVYLVCQSYVDYFSLLNMAYPIFLMLLCTAYAFLTRKIPGQFNEAKFIGFTLYTTCIIWLAMVPIYVLTSANIRLRLISVGVAFCLCATVNLACLFAPKVYIILFRPQRNVRMQTTKQASNCHQVVTQSIASHSAGSNMDETTHEYEQEQEML